MKENKSAKSAKSADRKSDRAGLLDEIRGLAIICMVVYHVMFSLDYFYNVDVPYLFEDWFYPIWALFAGSFIFISGTVCRYSRNNLKRGVQCFFLGMIVTFITAVITQTPAIVFGILHFLGVCMMLFGLGEALLDKIKPLAGIIISMSLFMLTWNVSGEKIKANGLFMRDPGYIGLFGIKFFSLPQILYNSKLLFPLGFADAYFASGDYFPLLPWMFLFLAGSYFGVYAKNGSCPKFFYSTKVGFLAAAGRHTIWIYLLHQPVAMGILYLIFN